jgi:hypothetical protein
MKRGSSHCKHIYILLRSLEVAKGNYAEKSESYPTGNQNLKGGGDVRKPQIFQKFCMTPMSYIFLFWLTYL